MSRLKRVIEGLTVVVIGCVLLANTLGVIPWRAWMDVFALWPLLIVAVGVDIVGKGLGRDGIRALASALVFGGLISAVVAAASGHGFVMTSRATAGASREFSYSEPMPDGVERGRAVIRGGAGSVRVRAGDALAEVRGSSPFEPEFRAWREGSTGQVEVSLGSHTSLWPGRTPPTELDVALNRDVPWDLAIEAGAAELEADLADVRLSRLRVDAGASESKVVFGAPSGVVPVELRTGVSSAILRFPQGSSFVIDVAGALTSFQGEGVQDADAGTRQRRYVHGDEDASDRYDVTIQAGVSTVTVELY